MIDPAKNKFLAELENIRLKAEKTRQKADKNPTKYAAAVQSLRNTIAVAASAAG